MGTTTVYVINTLPSLHPAQVDGAQECIIFIMPLEGGCSPQQGVLRSRAAIVSHGNRKVCRRNWATSGLFRRPLDVPSTYCDPTIQLPQTPIPFPSFQWMFSVCVCVSQHLFSLVTCLRKKKYLVCEPSLVFEHCYCFLRTINLLVIFIIIRVDLI